MQSLLFASMTTAGGNSPGTDVKTNGFFAGPLPAVYEKVVCDAGIASYTLMRGLVIAARGTELTLPSQPVRLSSSMRVTYAAISWLTGGRFGDSHDELLYVIRRPQDQFARVV